MLPEIKLSKFGIVFNSSVSFDDGGEIMLDWQENNGVYTACANGTWRLEKENLTNGARVKISAVLDKIYDKVEFKYFNIGSIAADHILPQSCFKGCKSRNLKLVEEPESIWGESVISITRDGVTLQLSTPYQAGFPAVYTATAKKQLLEDNRITSLVEFYGSTEFEFPALSVRESSDGYSMLNDYADENSIKPPAVKRNIFVRLIGITPEYTRGDKIIAYSVFTYTFIYRFIFTFIAVAIWNAFSPWKPAWWDKYFLITSLIVPGIVAAISSVWFLIGGIVDLRRLFIDLGKRGDIDESDNGQVRK